MRAAPGPRDYVCNWKNPRTGVVCGQRFNERANLKVSSAFHHLILFLRSTDVPSMKEEDRIGAHIQIATRLFRSSATGTTTREGT